MSAEKPGIGMFIIMTTKERIELGRKYIHGDGCLTDIERGFELWKGIEGELCREDRAIFDCIRNAKGVPEEGERSDKDDEAFSDHTVKISEEKESSIHSATDCRELFEKIFASASGNSQYNKIFNALKKIETSLDKAPKAPAEKKEENIRLGNNIGYIAASIGYTIPWFFKRINDIREQKGLKRKASPQGLYMVIGGYNGMDSATKMIIVEIVNAKNLLEDRTILTKDMRVQDLDLPHSEFSKLFRKKISA